MSLRFYLDENVPVEIARQLKARNIEAVTVRDLGNWAMRMRIISHEQLRRAMFYAPMILIILTWLLQAKNMLASFLGKQKNIILVSGFDG